MVNTIQGFCDDNREPEIMKLNLTTKFFLNFLLAIGMVVISMVYLIQYSFNRGFLNYVNTMEEKELGTLAESLEKAYGETGDWDFVHDNPRILNNFLMDAMPEGSHSRRSFGASRPGGPGRPQGRPPGGPPPGRGMANRPPPHDVPEGRMPFRHRIVLMDCDGKTLFGPPDHPDHMKTIELRYDHKTVGSLGLIPQLHLTENLQLRFVKAQKRAFFIIAFLTACVAALLSLPLARQMVKRIKALATGTHRLTAGHYDTRLPVGTKDELGQLVRDFNTLADTLEHNENMRKQLVGDVSHELRTPLAVLRGEIEALQDNIRPATPEALGSLHAEVMQLERLVGDLFQLSLSDMGALTYLKENLDMATLMDEAVASFKSRFAEKAISLVLNRPPEEKFMLFGDPGRLQQLFENLLSNTLKYTDPGGEVHIQLERTEQMLTITWQDSAPSVGPDEIERLFDRLYRVESSRNRALGGAGLGLAICKKIVEAHGGTISAEPSGLGGVLFKIEMPPAGGAH